MNWKRSFTLDEASHIGDQLGMDWNEFDVQEFRMGLDIELEHGTRHPETDVTGDDPIITGKIVLVHLKEFPDYYTRLENMEDTAEEDLIVGDH